MEPDPDPVGYIYLAILRLGRYANYQGFLRESDCRSILPRASYHAADIADLAEKTWTKQQNKNLWKVVWTAVRPPFLSGIVFLTWRGTSNAFTLPLLLKQVVDAVVDQDADRAVKWLLVLLAERLLGICFELMGARQLCGKMPNAFISCLGGLVARKAATPGVYGMADAGVDPVAFVGRELAMLYTRLGQMAYRGFAAMPTLVSGSITLLILLGWPALLGIGWVLSTIYFGMKLQSRGKAAEAKMSTYATERLGILGNVLAAIKAIKYFAWEPEFLLDMERVRNKECDALRMRASVISMATTLGKLTPVTGSLITFVTFAMLGNTIKASDIFACNSVFMTMRFSVGASGMLFELLKATQLTISRAEKVLRLPERPARLIQPSDRLTLTYTKDLSIAFESSGFMLTAAGSLNVGRRGAMTAICGVVGSGKSTFLSALVGAVDAAATVKGESRSVASIGWCPQKPFIISGTVLDNILLGRTLHQEQLEQCIADACFGRDLELLKDGLGEMVGDRGTTLSGGQQARLSLARALYGSPELLLLDDPLAAVDASVGRALLHALRVRCGQSGDAGYPSVVMVMNQVQLIPNFDEVVFISNGRLEMFASPEEFENSDGFEKFRSGIGAHTIAIDDEEDLAVAQEERRLSRRSSGVAMQLLQAKPRSSVTEMTATGIVKWPVFREFLFAPGKPFLGFIVSLFMVTYALLGLRDWWLGVWADRGGGKDMGLIATFVAFCFGHILGSILCVVAIGYFAKRVGQKLHSETIECLMRAPMSFFDETPAGRITSRFGADLGQMDNQLFGQMDFSMTFSFTFLVMCGTVVAKLPPMAVLFLAALALSTPVGRIFIILQQDLRRHSNSAQAPILSNLAEVQRGAAFIDILNCTSFFIERHNRSVDAWTILIDCSFLTGPMMESYCGIMHLFVIGCTGALTLLNMESLSESPGVVAMYFSYAALWGIFAQVSMGVVMMLLSTMTSLERLLEYKLGGFKQEPPWRTSSDPKPNSWPSGGIISFQDVKLRYRPELGLALDGFNLEIHSREKLGIVGRTGAGKSSITSVLFRLVECEAGKVTIDGVDIMTLGIHTLRKSLSMIPQEPLVMTGTVRYNLDPFGKYSNEELDRVLKEAGLAPAVSLDTLAGGGSATLSSGQKQLVTFGRTLLQGTRIVVMDEPTASVDMQTDRLLQIVARRAFADRTAITIAHRLETIQDCDRIAVMDAGRLVEIGMPLDLLKNPSSRLAAMHKAAAIPEKEAELKVEDINLEVAGCCFPPFRSFKKQVVVL